MRRATEGPPYRVTKTDTGLDVGLDIVDEQWFGSYSAAGLRKAYVHHVAVPDDGTYSVTDDALTVEWEAGVPTLSGSVERSRGRVWELSAEKVWAFDSKGDFGRVVDYRFDSEEGRRLVTGVAKQLGLKQKRGGEEKIGLVVALVGGVGAVLALVVLGVLALLGR